MNIESEQLNLAKEEAARTYLSSIKSLMRRLQLAEIEYKIAFEKSSGLTGIDYSRSLVQTSPTADTIPNAVIAYEKKRDELESLRAITKEVFEECFDLLHRLDDEEGTILRLRYLIGLKHREIAISLYMSERTIYRKMHHGLLHLYEQGIPNEFRINYQKAI